MPMGNIVRGVENSAASLVSASRVICARADLAYAHASLLRVHAKGTIGEALAQSAFLRNKLGEQISGKWTSIAPRTGRQGFDHLFVRKDGNRFKWMVCESKFGSSTLGVTKGGVRQMSWVWIHERAAKLGDAYIKLSERSVTFRKVPWFRSGVKTYDVPLDDGTKVTFWKDKDGKWHFNGTKEQLDKARETAKRMGLDLKSPTCNIRGRKFHIQAEGNDIRITLEDVKSKVGSKDVEAITAKSEIVLKDILGKKISDEELKRAMGEELRKKFPSLSKDEIRELVDEIAERKNNGSLIKEAMSIVGSVALQSALAAGASAAIDAGIQYVFARKLDLQRIALTAAAAAAGTAVGQIASIVFIKTKGGACVVRVLSRTFKLRSASLMRNSLAGGLGAVATSAVTAYGGVWLGKSTWEQAHQEFVVGVLGITGGAFTTNGVTALVAALCKASTETKIVLLSGAAQKNAILYWLGMGAGKSAGGVVLGVIGIVASIAISAAASAVISAYSESEERKYRLLLCEVYSRDGVWDTIARRH